MAQTLGQFIEECEFFEYSSEYYSMIKECNEMALMEKYLENQEFISNIPAASTFTEGYLMEAASEETTENVKKSLGEKAKGLVERVTKFFKNLIPKIIAAFTKFRNLFDSTTSDINAIYGYFKKNGVSKESYQVMDSIFKRVHQHKFDFTNNQPFKVSKLKIDYDNNPKYYVDAFLAFSLSNTTVIVKNSAYDHSQNKKKNRIGPVPINVISKICKAITNPKNKSYDYSGAIHTLEKASDDVNTNGMEIIVNSKDIDKIIKDFQDMNNNLTNKAGQVEYEKNNMVSNATGAAADHTSKEYNLIIDGINKINTSVASTLSLYTSFISYRREFASTMKSHLGLDKKSKKTDNDATPDTDEE